MERTEDDDSDSAQDESIVQCVPSAAMFTLGDMTNYMGQREHFVGNCGPQNEAKIVFTQELVEIIIHETNIYAEQCIMSRGLMISLRSRMRDWKLHPSR
jgi:hypothetical protein